MQNSTLIAYSDTSDVHFNPICVNNVLSHSKTSLRCGVLKCYLLNARSLKCKLGEFRHLLKIGLYDLILVTESWLDYTVPDALLVYDTPYNVIRRDRGSRGGGLLIAIKSCLAEPRVVAEKNIEAVRLIFDRLKLNLVLGYLPDGSDIVNISDWCSYLRIAATCNLRNVIVGDFNQAEINWAQQSCTSSSQRLFLNCCSELGLRQLVQVPTRGESILDLVLVDDDCVIFDVDVQEPFSTSDHCGVAFSISTGVQDEQKRTKDSRSKHINYESLCDFLGQIDWSQNLKNVKDVEVAWNIFQGFIDQGLAQYSTCKGSSLNRRRLPKLLAKLRSRKKKLWQHYKRTLLVSDKDAFNRARRDYAKAALQIIQGEEEKVLKDDNVSSLFKLVKKRTGLKRTIPPLHVNGTSVTEGVEKANVLNAAFSKNFIPDNGKFPTLFPYTDAVCESVDFLQAQVHSALSSLKNSNAVGPDGHSATFYKQIKQSISLPLTFIFSMSFESGRLPSCWKTANVVPIYKKGNAADPANYRPIALTAIPCKVMEKIIRRTMLTFLDDNSLLLKDQFGFLPGRSTVLQLLSVVDEWTKAMESRTPVDVILVDYAKAFDSVVHNKLLAKLEFYGFQGKLLKWIEGFLSNRLMRVMVDSVASSELPVISGVPQGSVLGPLLFVLYLNDLTVSPAQVKLNKFADDTKLHGCIKDESGHSELQLATDQLEKWSLDWQLPIAALKCSSFHIGRNNSFHEYSICGMKLPQLTEVRDLGVWFTCDLKASAHCRQIVKLAFQRSAIVKRCFTSGNLKLLVRAFKTYIRPIVEYASPVWSPYHIVDIELVESVQRRYTKYLKGMKNLTYPERLHALGLESLELRRLRSDLSLTFMIVRGHLNLDLSSFFRLRNDGRTRGHPFKLVVNMTYRECRRQFFACRVVKVWNDLPASVVMANNIKLFKLRLKSYDLKKHLLRF